MRQFCLTKRKRTYPWTAARARRGVVVGGRRNGAEESWRQGLGLLEPARAEDTGSIWPSLPMSPVLRPSLPMSPVLRPSLTGRHKRIVRPNASQAGAKNPIQRCYPTTRQLRGERHISNPFMIEKLVSVDKRVVCAHISFCVLLWPAWQ
jgi:hypothetical protein